MKTLHLKLFYLLFGFSLITYGQTLEKTYTTDTGYAEEPPNFAFFANNEMHYFTTEHIGDKENPTYNIKIYNISHQETKNINITNSGAFFTLKLPSDKLFNSDSKIEFIALKGTNDVERYSYKLYNEDGNQLFDFGLGYNHKLYKDNNGNYKLLISDYDGDNKDIGQTYRVYALSGTLSNKQENLLLNKVTTFPNPSSKVININNLKKHNGIVDVFTVTGKKVLSKKVDKSLNNISVDISNLSNGVYFYKIGDISKRFIKQ